MKDSNLFFGLIGFVLGRLSAEPTPAPAQVQVVYVPAAPPVSTPPRETWENGIVYRPLPTAAEIAFQNWRMFEPTVDYAYREDNQEPVYPRLGRAWPDEYRAEYLYWIEPGVRVRFPSTTGAGFPRQAGSTGGWVMVRDEPADGWWISPVVSLSELAGLAVAKVSKANRKRPQHRWHPSEPFPMAPHTLYPYYCFLGGPEDPLILLEQPWTRTLGFQAWGDEVPVVRFPRT
jgi:hypothetical protein